MKIRDIIQEDSGMGGVTSSGAFAAVHSAIGGMIKRSPLIGQSIYPAKKKKKAADKNKT